MHKHTHLKSSLTSMDNIWQSINEQMSVTFPQPHFESRRYSIQLVVITYHIFPTSNNSDLSTADVIMYFPGLFQFDNEFWILVSSIKVEIVLLIHNNSMHYKSC